jgi:hypothetical protein
MEIANSDTVVGVHCPACGEQRFTLLKHLGKAKCPKCMGVLMQKPKPAPEPPVASPYDCDACNPTPGKIIPVTEEGKRLWCKACGRLVYDPQWFRMSPVVPPQPDGGPTDDEIDAFMIEQARKALKRINERREREWETTVARAHTVEGKTR